METLTVENNEKEKIKFEKIEIEVPKKIMDLLRFAEKLTEETPKAFLEKAVMQEIRAYLDADGLLPDGRELAEQFSLKPIYKELLGRY